jgi:hypothetical protein
MFRFTCESTSLWVSDSILWDSGTTPIMFSPVGSSQRYLSEAPNQVVWQRLKLNKQSSRNVFNFMDIYNYQ